MCVCIWDDVWPSKKITRLLCGYAALLQILIAIAMLYLLLKEEKGPIVLGVAISLFCVLVLLALVLFIGICKQHTKILKVYFIMYAVVGLATIILLILNAFQLIDWREKPSQGWWMGYVLATAFTGIYGFSLGVLYFHITYLKDDDM